MPFGIDDEKYTSISFSVLHKPVEFRSTDPLSENAKLLLIGMLAKDKYARLSVEQIKNHVFFKGL